MISAVNDFSGNGLDHIFFQNDNGAVAMTGFPKKSPGADRVSNRGNQGSTAKLDLHFQRHAASRFASELCDFLSIVADYQNR